MRYPVIHACTFHMRRAPSVFIANFPHPDFVLEALIPRMTWMLIHIVFLLSFLLSRPTWAIFCLYESTSPSAYLPSIDDCIQLAAGIRALPRANENLAFATRPHLDIKNYVEVPHAWFHGSCYVDVWPDDQPWHDVSRFTDIAQIVELTAHECLPTVTELGIGYGGLEKTGANRFLIVAVSGIIHTYTRTRVGASEDGTQGLEPGNRTKIINLNVE